MTNKNKNKITSSSFLMYIIHVLLTNGTFQAFKFYRVEQVPSFHLIPHL